jgi:hypothetical protein
VNIETGAQLRPWAAAGPGGGDTAYRTQSLKYTPIELSLDESVSFQVLLRLWLSAVVVSWIVFIIFVLLWLFTGGASSSSTDAFGNSAGPNIGLLSVGALVSFLVFWVVLLFSRVPEPIAEWKVLLEGKSAAAEHAYAAIYGSLARRRIPVNTLPSRVRSDVLTHEVVNNRLIISDRGYQAYATVFAYGTSLYVGWTMWRNRLGAQLIWTFIKDLVGGMLGRTGVINQMLRTEKVRAMREAVHSAVREGVEVAIQGVEVSITSTFGYEIPIQDLTVPAPSPSAPAPAPTVPSPVAPQPVVPQPQMSHQPYGTMPHGPMPAMPMPQPPSPEQVAPQPPAIRQEEQPTMTIPLVPAAPIASQATEIQDTVQVDAMAAQADAVAEAATQRMQTQQMQQIRQQPAGDQV